MIKQNLYILLFNVMQETLNSIQTRFAIRDLENLSGIKAHTIRIWEKRYELLQPQRTDTNIRYYSLSELQKLLNISSLLKKGYKISKLADLPQKEIHRLIVEESSNGGHYEHYINSFKLSMLNFDLALFERTYSKLIAEHPFRAVFMEVFLPVLEHVGELWQTDSITPAHEHFISNLIKQKLYLNIERVQNQVPVMDKPVFVLYLPLNEVHELGLLYVHYELILKGYNSIYLGESVPMENLASIQEIYGDLVYISFFTVRPSDEGMDDYIEKMSSDVLDDAKAEFWIMGRKASMLDEKKLPKNVKVFKEIDKMLNKV